MEKQIIIKDYVKFCSLPPDGLDPIDCEPFYKHGYWNVYRYTQGLEMWLSNNQIDHIIKHI